MSEAIPARNNDRRGFISRIYEHGINWPASIGATILVSAGLSAALHQPNYRKHSVIDRVHTGWMWEPSVTMEQEISRHTNTQRTIRTVTRRIGGSKGTTNYSLLPGTQVWAEHFSNDPKAGEFTDPQAIEKVVEGIKAHIKSGDKIFSLSFQGFASAEDDSASGGLNRPSIKNKRLADKRAKVALANFKEAINEDPTTAKALSDTEFVLKAPVEQELTRKQVRRAGAIAKRYGLDTKELITLWNRQPAAISETDAKLLQNLLGKSRKVVITEAHGRPDKFITTEEDFCTDTVITDIKTKTHKDKEDIPLPLIIPIPIPRRRRKEAEPSATPQAEPTKKAGDI